MEGRSERHDPTDDKRKRETGQFFQAPEGSENDEGKTPTDGGWAADGGCRHGSGRSRERGLNIRASVIGREG